KKRAGESIIKISERSFRYPDIYCRCGKRMTPVFEDDGPISHSNVLLTCSDYILGDKNHDSLLLDEITEEEANLIEQERREEDFRENQKLNNVGEKELRARPESKDTIPPEQFKIIKERISNLSKSELSKMINIDFADYREEKIQFAKKELKKRDIEEKYICEEDIEEKIYDQKDLTLDKRRKSSPLSLQVIAFFFILIGILAAIDIFKTFINMQIDKIHIRLNFSVLGIFIGPGLLKHSRGWRICALIFIWIALIGIPIMSVFLLLKALPLGFTPFLIPFFIFLIALWEYHVLTSPDILKLFGVYKPLEMEKEIPGQDIFICDNCNNKINEKDNHCSYCGAIFADIEKKCYKHNKVALGICLICKKAFCNECIVEIKNKFFCKEHSTYNFTDDGWSSVYETNYDYNAEVIKEDLNNNNIPCIIDNRKDRSFQLSLGQLGGILVRVPFDYVLEAEKIIQR
ncbi:MAG: hypothetical protein ACFFDN_19385, partial [Candidatus Hodarchaeota archaeon]